MELELSECQRRMEDASRKLQIHKVELKAVKAVEMERLETPRRILIDRETEMKRLEAKVELKQSKASGNGTSFDLHAEQRFLSF